MCPMKVFLWKFYLPLRIKLSTGPVLFQNAHPLKTHTLLIHAVCSQCGGSIGGLLRAKGLSAPQYMRVSMHVHLPVRCGITEGGEAEYAAIIHCCGSAHSHVSAGDQCQTGKVTGLQSVLSPSLQSLKNPADDQVKFDSVKQIIFLSRRHGAMLRFRS